MSGSDKYSMRQWINLFENNSDSLYHGTSLDNMWMIMRDGKLDSTVHGFDHDGPAGISLSRSFKVAMAFANGKTELLNDSFFDYFKLGKPPELKGVVFEFDRSKISQKIIHYNDFGPGEGDKGGGEEEERVLGTLPLEPALVAIYADVHDIKIFLDTAVKAFHSRPHAKMYGKDFQDIVNRVLRDPRLKSF